MCGRAMAQAVSRRPLTAEAQVRSRVSLCGICDGQSVNFILPVLHYTEKRERLIIFMTRLHNKPQVCGVSVASAEGPSQKKTTMYIAT
jgi:hypothetical protein